MSWISEAFPGIITCTAHVSLARTDEYASRHAENVDEYANYKRPITQTLRTLRDVKHVISMKI